MRDGALDYPRQDEDGGFRKTFVIIAVVHLVLLGGLLLAALYQPKQTNDSVVWMSPGSFAGETAATQTPVTGDRDSQPAPNEGQPSHQETDQQSLSPPTATPPPIAAPPPVLEESAISTSTPTATPIPRLTATPTPRPTPTAKPPPKPSPKPTPKPSAAHSATPKSRPEVASKEKPKIDDSPKPKTSPMKSEEKANSSPGPNARLEDAGRGKLPHDQTTPGRGLQSRSGGETGAGQGKDAGSGDSALAAYVGILTERFQAAWNQPTSEMTLGKTLEVTVKLKVEADGTVTEFVIVEGSGNAVVDDSVRDAGKKITKLPPPPNGQGFSAPVRFELGN